MSDYSELEVFLIRRAYESELAVLRDQVKVLREALEDMEGWDVQGLRLKDSYDDTYGPGSWDRLLEQTKPKEVE